MHNTHPTPVQKAIAISQSNYIPWKGYFDLIAMADEFVLYDDMQYTRRDWRNRNKIVTREGLKWLTIDVKAKGNYEQPIKEVEVADSNWAEKHWKTIEHNYAKALFFKQYKNTVQGLYEQAAKESLLSRVNYLFLSELCRILGITTQLSWSMDYYPLKEEKTARLVDICNRAGANQYWSGPAAKAYMNETLFKQAGVAVNYMDYSDYPQYRQMREVFEHGVSVLDLIFNEGPDAPKFMKFSTAEVVTHV